MSSQVMLFGTFDILHAGHIALFKQAQRFGKLVVVVARDSRVKEVKGASPVHNERERLEILRHIDLVDEAVLGDKRDVYKIIYERRPDVIALGYDQLVFINKLPAKLKEYNLNTKIVRLRPYKPRTRKSGKIRRYLSRIV